MVRMIARLMALIALTIGTSCQPPTTETDVPTESVATSAPIRPRSPKELLKNQPKQILDLTASAPALSEALQSWCASIQPLLEEPSIQAAIAKGRYYIAFKFNSFAFRNTDQVPPIFEALKAQLEQCHLGTSGPPNMIQFQWYDATAAADRTRRIAYPWLVVDLED